MKPIIWTCMLLFVHRMGPVMSLLSDPESYSNDEEQIVLQFSAENIGTIDHHLYFEVYYDDDPRIVLYKSEKIKRGSTNLKWKRFILSTDELCNTRHEKPFIVAWFDSKWLKKSLILEEKIKLSELEEGKREFIVPIKETRASTEGFSDNIFKKQNDTKENQNTTSQDSVTTGKIKVELFHIIQPYSFLDYVKCSLKIHCTLAIDFSASSSEEKIADFQEALGMVVSLVESYPMDKFSIIGFGAELSCPAGRSPNGEDVICSSQHHKSDILNVYRDYARQIRKPTSANFAPVIRRLINIARDTSKASPNNYFLLIIFTDGRIDDEEKTIEAITEASTLPISIVVVGLGAENYETIETLVAHVNRLETNAERDIVLFIPSTEISSDEVSLGKQLLADIPHKAVSYSRSHKIGEKSTPNATPFTPSVQPVTINV